MNIHHCTSRLTDSSSTLKMSPSLRASLLAVVCAVSVELCLCFPNGSVAFSCGNMMPEHPPFMPSTSSPPFRLSTSSATYKPGKVITVTVEALESSSVEFQGFLLQARSRQGNAVLWPVGKFTNIDPSKFTALHCQNQQNSTVSQASGVKQKKVDLSWQAPGDTNYGDVYFSVTLVQDYTTFWVQVNSSSVRLDTSQSAAAGVGSSLALMLTSLLSLSTFSQWT